MLAWPFFGVCATISSVIGKDRKPMTHGTAVGSLVVSMLLAAGIVTLYLT